MGIIPTIERTIDEFRRATSCRIELDNGGTKISGPGPLQSAAAFLQQQSDTIARLTAEVDALREVLAELVAVHRLEADIQRWVRDEATGHQWPEMQPYARRMAAAEELKTREQAAWPAAFAIVGAARKAAATEPEP